MSALIAGLRRLTAVAILAAYLVETTTAAVFGLPAASGINPGDVIVESSGQGWVKFDPTTKQLFSLPWTHVGGSHARIRFDNDGTILASSDSGKLYRVHPTSGAMTQVDVGISVGDFGILPNGDYIIAKKATSSIRVGDQWSGGFDGGLLRYSRATNQMSAFPTPVQFAPLDVTIGHGGEVYVRDFFRDLVQVDFGVNSIRKIEMNLTTPSARVLGSTIAVLSDGRILTNVTQPAGSPIDAIVAVDPLTGEESLLGRGTSFGISSGSIALDNDGNLVFVAAFKLYQKEFSANSWTLMASPPSFFTPRGIAVVPPSWTPPPIPEPASLQLIIGVIAIVLTRRRVPLLASPAVCPAEAV